MPKSEPVIKGDIEWGIMDKDVFFDYLKKMKDRNRADRLFELYAKWRKGENSEEDSIRKAFASLHIEEADKRLKTLEENWSEEELAEKLDKKQHLTDAEKKAIDEFIHWKYVKGHALTQHQKGQKFFVTSHKEQINQLQPKYPRPRPSGQNRGVIAVRVLSNNNPLQGVSVSINGTTKNTNNSGLVRFPNVTDPARIILPQSIRVNEINYVFSSWYDDAIAGSVRDYSLQPENNLVAMYNVTGRRPPPPYTPPPPEPEQQQEQAPEDDEGFPIPPVPGPPPPGWRQRRQKRREDERRERLRREGEQEMRRRRQFMEGMIGQPEPPPEGWAGARVIVDSHPMREVHIDVHANIPAERRSVTFQEIFNILNANYDPQFSNHHATQIVNQLIPDFIAFIGPLGPARPAVANARGNIIAALIALPGVPAPRAIPAGVMNPDVQETIVNLLIQRYYEVRFREVPLDDWRRATIEENRRRAAAAPPQPPLPIPFVLTRPQGYLVNYSENPVSANQYTIFTLELPPGKYKFTASEPVPIRVAEVSDKEVKEKEKVSATFDRWDIIRESVVANIEDIRSESPAERVIRSRRTAVTSHWNRVLEIPDVGRQITRNGQQVPETIRIIAYYKAEQKFDRFRPGITSPYQGGTSGGAYNTGRFARRDSAYRAFSAKAFQRGGIDRNREAEKAKFGKESGYANVNVRAAVNKGKRILNQYARAEYTRIFARTRREFDDRAARLRELRAEARTARRNLRRALRQQMGWFKGRLFGGQTDQDLVNRATDTLQVGGAIAGGITAVQLQEWRDTLEKFNKAYDEYFRDFKQAIESDSAQMESHMLERAATVSIQLARRFRMPLNGSEENEVAGHLRAYALEITERFVSRGRTAMFAMTRGLENLSRGLQTGSEMGMGLLENTINFIFGPWTWTTIFALLEFFFVLTYIGYNITYLWIFPLIGAGFTFLLNFSDSFRPLDWLTHLSSGAIIGYSSVLLLIALGALGWSFMTTFWFWIIWAILGFLGVMQFYQTGGWKTVMQGGVIILLFAWLALGPYAAYYQQAIGQIKTPVEIAYRAVSNAVTDVWLLATNPTEWYARQQLVNVRPEKPLDFPKGIEVSLLDALPPSVPTGREFAITTVIKNEGSIKEPARDIVLSFGCNQWCTPPAPDPALTQAKYSVCNDVDVLTRNELYCAEDCGQDTPISGATNLDLPACVQRCITEGSSTPLSVLNANNCVTTDVNAYVRDFGFVHKMERGDTRAISVRGFIATGETRRVAETRLAEVTMNVSYRFSTSTSLQTEVMTQQEIDRRIQENENIFRNVVAVTKSSPAQLSLNVGPQPLVAGQRSLLLVSVSNTRDESSVVLKRGTQIIINMPKVVGTGLQCENINGVEKGENWVVTYTVPQGVTVLPYEFRSIFAFICSFTAADPSAVVDVKTALITAEMPDYTFVLTKEKQIPVTAPLGILSDPFEYECNDCGDGAFDKCGKQACYDLTNYDPAKGRVGTCWWEFSDKTIGGAATGTIVSYLGYRCHSCHPNIKCEEFLTPGDCNEQSKRCGLSCEWDNEATHPKVIEVNKKLRDSHLDPTDGACKEKVVAGASLGGIKKTGAIAGDCDAVPSNFKSTYERHKDTIATYINLWELDQHIGGPEAKALVSAVISQESGWNERASGDGGQSAGLMQIRISKHPECASLGDLKNDPKANINCGTRILADMAKRPDINTPKRYDCKSGVSYQGIDAILRYYNGWPDPCPSDPNKRGNVNYVDDVKSKGHLQNWINCFESAKASAPTP